MLPKSRLVLSFLALALVACGKGADSSGPGLLAPPAPQKEQPAPQPEPPLSEPTPAPGPAPAPVPAPEPAPAPIADPGAPAYHRASLWARHAAHSEPWTQAVISIIRTRIHDFERAADVEVFCPGYREASARQREICWLRLVGGVVEFESSFKPDEKPFYEGHGVYSVGLLALSTGECKNAMTTRELMDPVKNLICGVNRMAMLIARGRAIDSPEHKGACAYWSTLRPPHKAQLPDGRWVILGKKNQIIDRTKLYRQF
jgi:hypothetical protein